MKPLIINIILLLSFSCHGQGIPPSIAGKFPAGDVNLFIECYGSHSEATFVVHSAFNAFGSEGSWSNVIEGISDKTRICVYDRANSGKSGRAYSPYSYKTSAVRLNKLLKSAGVKPPFIMVGHSFGSYPVRFYNHLFTEDVAGIMLIDPTQYGMWYNKIAKWQPSLEEYSEEQEKDRLLELEVFNNPQDTKYNPFSIDIRNSEYELKDTSDFGDKPFVLLWAKGSHDIGTSPSPGSHPDVWFRMAAMFKQSIENMHTQLSSNTKIVYSQTTEHDIFVHEPETVIVQMQKLLDSVNNGR